MNGTIPMPTIPVPADGRQVGIASRLDMNEGVMTAGGSRDAYLELLRLFVKTHVHDDERLDGLLEKGDVPGLLELAHTLKGSASSLGLHDVDEKARALEAGLKQSFPFRAIRALTEALSLAVGQAVLDIRVIQSEGERKEADVHLDTPIQFMLAELRRLLEERDFAAHHYHRSISRVLKGRFGYLAARLSWEMDLFNYGMAAEVVDELLALG